MLPPSSRATSLVNPSQGECKQIPPRHAARWRRSPKPKMGGLLDEDGFAELVPPHESLGRPEALEEYLYLAVLVNMLWPEDGRRRHNFEVDPVEHPVAMERLGQPCVEDREDRPAVPHHPGDASHDPRDGVLIQVIQKVPQQNGIETIRPVPQIAFEESFRLRPGRNVGAFGFCRKSLQRLFFPADENLPAAKEILAVDLESSLDEEVHGRLRDLAEVEQLTAAHPVEVPQELLEPVREAARVRRLRGGLLRRGAWGRSVQRLPRHPSRSRVRPGARRARGYRPQLGQKAHAFAGVSLAWTATATGWATCAAPLTFAATGFDSSALVISTRPRSSAPSSIEMRRVTTSPVARPVWPICTRSRACRLPLTSPRTTISRASTSALTRPFGPIVRRPSSRRIFPCTSPSI